jgi:hypothetical protein
MRILLASTGPNCIKSPTNNEVWEAPRRGRNRENEAKNGAVEEDEPVIVGPVQDGRRPQEKDGVEEEILDAIVVRPLPEDQESDQLGLVRELSFL